MITDSSTDVEKSEVELHSVGRCALYERGILVIVLERSNRIPLLNCSLDSRRHYVTQSVSQAAYETARSLGCLAGQRG